MKIKALIAGLLIAMSTGTNAHAYTEITVDGGNLSGYRESNAVVDVGYGDREYYAYTNEHGQLISIKAERIIPHNAVGRIYDDEAKVSGTERYDLDEGHVIADSLGGVANAYNITPQDSELNREGAQYQMEELIRNAGGCTNFTAVISYPNAETQIPSHYSYTFTINGVEKHFEFDNNTESNSGHIYVAEGNSYYHYDRNCKFISDLNVTETNNIEGKYACHCAN